MVEIGAVSGRALGLGMVVTAFVFGLRHGIDWDHLAAITDLTGSQSRPRRSMLLATCYALGHGAVVFALGRRRRRLRRTTPERRRHGDGAGGRRDAAAARRVRARVAGAARPRLPDAEPMDARHRGRPSCGRRDPGSRRTLSPAGVRGDRARASASPRHRPRPHASCHLGRRGSAPSTRTGQPRIRAQYQPPTRRTGTATATCCRCRPIRSPGRGSAARSGIGALHGVGAETPTQVVVFVGAAGASGPVAGLCMLASFVVGLLVSNTAVAAITTFGRVTQYASIRGLRHHLGAHRRLQHRDGRALRHRPRRLTPGDSRLIAPTFGRMLVEGWGPVTRCCRVDTRITTHASRRTG